MKKKTVPTKKELAKKLAPKNTPEITTRAKVITVKTRDVEVVLTMTEDIVTLTPSAEVDEYLFKNKNTVETIEKWSNVIEAMQNALEVLKKQRSLDGSVK